MRSTSRRGIWSVRAQIRANTALGQAIKRYNDRGGFVPDEVMVALVTPLLKTARSWILDGFPRTVVQARALDSALHTGTGALEPGTHSVTGYRAASNGVYGEADGGER